MGLTLVYKSSRVLNFAHGDMGALPAGLVLLAVLKWDVPYWVAIGGALVAGLAIGAMLEFLVIRRLASTCAHNGHWAMMEAKLVADGVAGRG